MAKRDRGAGMLYKPRGSSRWWVQYHMGGVRQRESTGTDNKVLAKKFLQDRLAAVSAGHFLGAEMEKVSIGELVEDFLKSPEKHNSKAWDDDNRRWQNHLRPEFAHVRASRISTPMLNRYIAKRQQGKIRQAIRAGNGKDYSTTSREGQKKPSNGTINRELSLLRAAYHYGAASHPPKVARVPRFDLLPESAPRKGFLPDDKFDALASACATEGLWLRAALELWATYGWRLNEPLQLTVAQCDFAGQEIVLDPGSTKNGEGRKVPMTGKVYELLAALCMNKRTADRVFTYSDGSPVKGFRKTWQRVCEEAGCPDLHVHDLRRTGARNMRRMGIHEAVIMRIGGWKTRSVFDRYNIVDDSDLRDAVRRIEHQQKARRFEFSHSSATGTVQSAEVEESAVAN